MSDDVVTQEAERWEGKNRFVQVVAQHSERWEGKNRFVQVRHPDDPEVSDDTKADVKAGLIVFGCLLLMAIHFVSGWTFDI